MDAPVPVLTLTTMTDVTQLKMLLVLYIHKVKIKKRSRFMLNRVGRMLIHTVGKDCLVDLLHLEECCAFLFFNAKHAK